MNNRYFENSVEWSEESTSSTGLPRPFAHTTKKSFKNKYYSLPKIVPIPWQSKPNFKTGGLLKLNVENENKIYAEDLCPYCGITIERNENSARWHTSQINKLIETRDFVFSDIHPFHKKCMKEGRTFCPFMKTLNDNYFEYNNYTTLKQKAIIEKETAENASKK